MDLHLKGPILIVDDDEAYLDLVVSALAPKGYYFITYTDVSKAIIEVENNLNYKVAFIDIHFPGKIGGDAFVEASKRYNRHVPVYTISGHNWALEGSDGIIVKDGRNIQNIERLLEKWL